MNVEKSNEIFNQNLRLLSTINHFKIDCWNGIITLHHMKKKDDPEYTAYGWDRRPENYEVEKSFLFHFVYYRQHMAITCLQSGNAVISFNGLNVLSNEHSMYSLTHIFEELSEFISDDVQYNFFAYENGMLFRNSGKYVRAGEKFDDYMKNYVTSL